MEQRTVGILEGVRQQNLSQQEVIENQVEWLYLANIMCAHEGKMYKISKKHNKTCNIQH